MGSPVTRLSLVFGALYLEAVTSPHHTPAAAAAALPAPGAWSLPIRVSPQYLFVLISHSGGMTTKYLGVLFLNAPSVLAILVMRNHALSTQSDASLSLSLLGRHGELRQGV